MERQPGVTHLAIALGLAACGTGERLPTVTVSFDPPTMEASYRADGQTFSMPSPTITAFVEDLPGSGVHAYILQDAPILTPATSVIPLGSDGSYLAYLVLQPSLGAGVHTGTLRLRLCRDAGCAAAYPVVGGELPYTLTVVPGMSLTKRVNGALVTSKNLATRDGDMVELSSSEPVYWSMSYGGGYADGVTSTTTSWKGTMRYGLSTPGGTGYMVAAPYSIAAPQAQLEVFVDVTE